MNELQKYLSESASWHHHLCPRQVLGVRMGMYAGQLLDIPIPQTDKNLLAISETDGCFVSGISVTTGCWVSRRTLRIEDYGKVAATFIQVKMKQAFRKNLQLSEANLDKLRIINDIIEDYRQQGYRLTLRQLYYQLVSKDIIRNLRRATRQGIALNLLRRTLMVHGKPSA